MLESREVERRCFIDAKGMSLLQRAISKLDLPVRRYYRTLKVARSITDLAGAEDIGNAYVAEALDYRPRLDERRGGRRT
jgi:magnesium chelatase family protein